MDVIGNVQGRTPQVGTNAANDKSVDGSSKGPNVEQQNNTANNDKNQAANEKDVKKAVEKLNKFIDSSKTHFEYETQKELNRIIVKVVNNETKEVIKEIPSKKILDMIAQMCELAGVLVDEKA